MLWYINYDQILVDHNTKSLLNWCVYITHNTMIQQLGGSLFICWYCHYIGAQFLTTQNDINSGADIPRIAFNTTLVSTRHSYIPNKSERVGFNFAIYSIFYFHQRSRGILRSSIVELRCRKYERIVTILPYCVSKVNDNKWNDLNMYQEKGN